METGANRASGTAPNRERLTRGAAATVSLVQDKSRHAVSLVARGVISPLLANVYLHWFDKMFHRADGPAQWANAKLVRYADDFVVLAKYQGPRLRGWIEEKIEKWLKLEINRDKTRVVDLREEQASLDFLGYTFHWHRDLYGRGDKYLNVEPSKKALQRERDRINEMTDRRQGCTPIPRPIDRLNRQLDRKSTR